MAESASDVTLPVEVYVFWGDGCPHCADQKPFLRALEADYPNVTMYEFEIWREARYRPRP